METPNLLAEYRQARMKVKKSVKGVFGECQPVEGFTKMVDEGAVKDFYYLVAVETFMKAIKKLRSFAFACGIFIGLIPMLLFAVLNFLN